MTNMKRLSVFMIAIVLLFALVACGSSNSAAKPSGDSSSASAAASLSSSTESQTDSNDTQSTASDKEQLRADLENEIGNSIFYKSIRNDKTGNWRELVYYSEIEPQEFASEYYAAYFESDNEIHSIVNLGLKKTANVSLVGNDLFIDVHEYVDGEEHDATKLFSGDLLAQYSVNKDTGTIEKLS